jgi:hypothetical protein
LNSLIQIAPQVKNEVSSVISYQFHISHFTLKFREAKLEREIQFREAKLLREIQFCAQNFCVKNNLGNLGNLNFPKHGTIFKAPSDKYFGPNLTGERKPIRFYRWTFL